MVKRPEITLVCVLSAVIAGVAVAEQSSDRERDDVDRSITWIDPDSSGMGAQGVPSDFEYRCVVVSAPSGVDRTATLPDGVAEVDEGTTVYVELWATDSGATNTGLVSVYADLDYPEGCATLDAVTPTALFSLFGGGIDTGSIVDELGGSQLSAGVGVEPEWARVAYIEFSVGSSCPSLDFQLGPAASESSAFNRGLIPVAEIAHGACSVVVNQLCVDDTDCDNGVFCDGAEICDPAGDCLVGESPCAEDECCDEDLNTCSPCPPASDFTYRCVVVDAPSDTNQATSLPAGIGQVSPGGAFFVEFWASDTGETNTGLVSVYADLDYPELSVSTDSAWIFNTALFSLFPDGTDTGAIIDELGGSQLAGGVGNAPEWARVAYVEFTADQGTPSAQFALQPGSSESSALNRGLILPADIDYGTCSVAITTTGCQSLEASQPPNCALDARQPSQPDGSNTAGWESVELTFDSLCDASSLAEEDFVIEVEPDGIPPTINQITAVGNTVTIEFSPFIELERWTCFSHAATTGRACLGYLPGNVNSDSTSSPAIDLSALIDCLNSPGTCHDWQQNINRDSASNVADLTRLIDLFNGAAHYDNWTGAGIASCPSAP